MVDDVGRIEAKTRENITLLRERLGWSQATLAARLGDAGLPGMHQTTIARIEKGDRPLRIAEAVVLADVFNVDLLQLTGVAAHSVGLDVAALTHRSARTAFSNAVESYTDSLVALAIQGDKEELSEQWQRWFEEDMADQTPARMSTDAKHAARAHLKRAMTKQTPIVKRLIEALDTDHKTLWTGDGERQEAP